MWRLLAGQLGLGFALVASASAQVLEGKEAYSDWRADQPGLRRLIRPQDMPAPDLGHRADTPQRLTARPADALPKAPPGFKVELLLDGLTNPRIIRLAPDGSIYVSETRVGRVRVLRIENGRITRNEIFAEGLDKPFGIAFPPGDDPRFVYIATETRVLRYPWAKGDLRARGKAEVLMEGIPREGHTTRDIAFSKDGSRLYLSVGSLGNAGETMQHLSATEIARHERQTAPGASWGPEAGRALVYVMDANGRNRRIFATGLRNCVGLAVDPATDIPWCSTNERDLIGDDLPPDYVTRLRDGGFFGWPWFYIGAHEEPRWKGARPDLATKVIVPDVLVQPHSAALGMTFYTAKQFPEEMRGSAFVALHGSWNRAKRVGSKVIRIVMKDGEPTGEYEDFLTGFTDRDETVWGRVVGVTQAQDGSLLVSDDGGNVIWRVSYAP